MYIFLDIDGVMVKALSYKSLEIMDDGFCVFEEYAVKALNYIISQTRAEVILTTSHKSKYTPKEWFNIFTRRGVNLVTIDCLPENVLNFNRKEELVEWFSYNTMLTDDFVIIDDDKILNDLPKHLKRNLIQPSSSLGLTKELAELAVFVLHR